MQSDVIALRAQLHQWIDHLDAEALLALKASISVQQAEGRYTSGDISVFYERSAAFESGSIQAFDAEAGIKELRSRASNIYLYCNRC